jgi:signal peptidase II
VAGDAPTAEPVVLDRHPLAVRVGLLVTAAFVVLDQATKELAEATLDAGRFVPLLGEHVGWQLVYNPGGAFGLPAPSWLFLSVTVIVTVIVLRNLPRTASLVAATAYGLLLAGALGNVVDRLFRAGDPDGWPVGDGYVVDFVAWGTFPRFNVADSAITVGFVLLLLALWQEEKRLAAAHAADTASDDVAASERTGPDHPESDAAGSADHPATDVAATEHPATDVAASDHPTGEGRVHADDGVGRDGGHEPDAGHQHDGEDGHDGAAGTPGVPGRDGSRSHPPGRGR